MTYKHWSNVAGPGDMTFVTTTAEGFRPVREPGGELLASFESGGAARYYHFDALGSTVLLSDASGNATSSYAYGAWGEVLNTPAVAQPYEYVGQLGYYTHTTAQGSELSDWLQLGFRFYQPGIGRFERRGSPYVYGAGMPTVKVQASGTEPAVRNAAKTKQKKGSKLRTCVAEAGCCALAAGLMWGYADTILVLGCAAACGASGPGWAPCLASCVEVVVGVQEATIAAACGADFVACVVSSPPATPCLDAARKCTK